jgi:hypothetical protein
MEHDPIRRVINQKSRDTITDQYLVERIELIWPVFDKIAVGLGEYHFGNFAGKELAQQYYDNLSALNNHDRY